MQVRIVPHQIQELVWLSAQLFQSKDISGCCASFIEIICARAGLRHANQDMLPSLWITGILPTILEIAIVEKVHEAMRDAKQNFEGRGSKTSKLVSQPSFSIDEPGFV
jgi:hypothetical protein